MPSAVIVIGAVEGVRRELERRVKDRAELSIVRLTREGWGGFRLEPYVDNAIQMVEAASDKAEDFGRVLVIQLPYASCPPKLLDSIATLESLGATVLRPAPAVSPWPSRPKALDDRFRQALQNALSSTIEDWLPGEPPEESLDDAIQRARIDFAETLQIPADVLGETHLQGAVWYRALQAMDELCQMERRRSTRHQTPSPRIDAAARVRRPRRTEARPLADLSDFQSAELSDVRPALTRSEQPAGSCSFRSYRSANTCRGKRGRKPMERI